MSLTINDWISEDGAVKAMNILKSIDLHLTSINLLIGGAQAECDVDTEDMKATLSELENSVNFAFTEIDSALNDYNSEAMHTESLETTERV